jgi:hypothetical protein
MIIEDKIVSQVITKFATRSEIGIKKYNTTLAENEKDDFLNHAIEEAMDLILYLTKVKEQIKKLGYEDYKSIFKDGQ